MWWCDDGTTKEIGPYFYENHTDLPKAPRSRGFHSHLLLCPSRSKSASSCECLLHSASFHSVILPSLRPHFEDSEWPLLPLHPILLFSVLIKALCSDFHFLPIPLLHRYSPCPRLVKRYELDEKRIQLVQPLSARICSGGDLLDSLGYMVRFSQGFLVVSSGFEKSASLRDETIPATKGR
jgi:hypothetical protein